MFLITQYYSDLGNEAGQLKVIFLNNLLDFLSVIELGNGNDNKV